MTHKFKRVFQKIIPQNNREKNLLLISLLLCAPIYLSRGWWDEIRKQGMGVGFLIIGLSPIIFMYFIYALYHFYSVIRSRFHPAGSWRPLFHLFFIWLIVSYAPVPLINEEAALLKHRAKYEDLVEMVLNDKLPHGECSADHVLDVPQEYKELATNCIIYRRGVDIEFNLPNRGDYKLMYIIDREKYISIYQNEPCNNPSHDYLIKKIDNHWYVCLNDAN